VARNQSTELLPTLKRLVTRSRLQELARQYGVIMRRTRSMDSLGEQTLETLVAFTAIRLEYGWQTTPADASRLEHLVSVQRINQIEAAMGQLVN
jgi:hypothetical protein